MAGADLAFFDWGRGEGGYNYTNEHFISAFRHIVHCLSLSVASVHKETPEKDYASFPRGGGVNLHPSTPPPPPLGSVTAWSWWTRPNVIKMIGIDID